MSEIHQNLNQKAVPFFARYLEGQIDFYEEVSQEETGTVLGGVGKTKAEVFKPDPSKKILVAATNKFPSDGDDHDIKPVTQKYASDQKTVPVGDTVVTQKYPSDGDDCILTVDNIIPPEK